MSAAQPFDSSRWLSWFFVTVWGSGYLASKVGLQYAPPFTFLTLRFAFGIALLVPLALVARPVWPRGAQISESTAVLMENRTREWVNRLKVPDLAPGRYGVTWKVYSAFEPKRPNERAGLLLETKEWSWERSAAPPKPSSR